MTAPIFILGSGPSLVTQEHLMPELGKRMTFACNRLHLWEGLTFTPDYYACSITKVREGIEPMFAPHVITKFAVSYFDDPIEGWRHVRKSKKVDILLPGPRESRVTGSEILVRTGFSQTFIVAQIAAWKFFDELYFLGNEQTREGKVYDLEADRLEPPPLQGWVEMKKLYEANGIKMRDCTPGGRLNDILEYVPLEEVLG